MLEWIEYIKRFQASSAASVLRTSVSTVRSWQQGRRAPRDWQQLVIREKLGEPPPPDAPRKQAGRPFGALGKKKRDGEPADDGQG